MHWRSHGQLKRQGCRPGEVSRSTTGAILCIIIFPKASAFNQTKGVFPNHISQIVITVSSQPFHDEPVHDDPHRSTPVASRLPGGLSLGCGSDPMTDCTSRCILFRIEQMFFDEALSLSFARQPGEQRQKC